MTLPPDGDLVGQVLDGRYTVLAQLGAGAMGRVYRAERVGLGKPVAIKVMNERLPDEMASRKRFEREATAMAKLDHPHCGSVLDFGVHDRRPYLVMEFVSGDTLASLVDRGPVPMGRAIEIMRQVLSGLAHAHEHGIIHRDIKPANVMLSQKTGLGDHVKILDFGLARRNEDSSNLTAGVILGTPSYMAPEQIRGLVLDGRVDLYACGVMLYELVTGKKPFVSANNDPLGVCMMHLNVPAPTLDGPLGPVVARALEKDRDMRFAKAEDFAAALAAVAPPRTATPPVGVPTAGVPTAVLTPSSLPSSPMPPMQPSMSPTVQPSPTGQSSQSGSPSWQSGSGMQATAVPHRGNGRVIAAAIGAVVAIAAVAAIVASRGGGSTTSTTATKPVDRVATPPAIDAPAPSTDDVEDPVAKLIADSHGRNDVLIKARKTYPQDPRIPYQLARNYLDKMYFNDGLPYARAAIALDPKYKSDDALIKALIRGFNAGASYDSTIARFMREEIGDPAKPYLEETAKSHPNPIVRKRAANELARY